MKFKLDQKVNYEGNAGIVWDYSHRYKEYTIEQNGSYFRNVAEKELSAVKPMRNSTNIKIPGKYESMIELVFQDADGFWCYSADGFYFGGNGIHTAHEYNKKDLLSMIRTLKPCECEECKSTLEGTDVIK